VACAVCWLGMASSDALLCCIALAPRLVWLWGEAVKFWGGLVAVAPGAAPADPLSGGGFGWVGGWPGRVPFFSKCPNALGMLPPPKNES